MFLSGSLVEKNRSSFADGQPGATVNYRLLETMRRFTPPLDKLPTPAGSRTCGPRPRHAEYHHRDCFERAEERGENAALRPNGWPIMDAAQSTIVPALRWSGPPFFFSAKLDTSVGVRPSPSAPPPQRA